jgi:hypothetical protein
MCRRCRLRSMPLLVVVVGVALLTVATNGIATLGGRAARREMISSRAGAGQRSCYGRGKTSHLLKDLLAYQMPVPSAVSLIFAAAMLRVCAWCGPVGLVGNREDLVNWLRGLLRRRGILFGFCSFRT